MPKFTVKDTPILHDGKRYEVGDTIELEQATADELAIYLNPALENESSQSEVSEEDIEQAEANIAEAEKAKGKKK